MVHVHLAFEPHVGTPIVNRAEAEAARLYRGAKKIERSPSSVISPTPMPHCSLPTAGVAPAAPSSSFS